MVGGLEEKPEQVDDLNKKLLTNINASGKLHMVPANVMDQFVIRFCVVQQHATREDIGKFLSFRKHTFISFRDKCVTVMIRIYETKINRIILSSVEFK